MKITISEEEIKSRPNDAELGDYVKSKWFELKKVIEMDKCVICGKTSPYKYTDSIYHRIGYVEGGGQACFQPKVCS